eukprot:7209405-Prymnesium_polylepis.2
MLTTLANDVSFCTHETDAWKSRAAAPNAPQRFTDGACGPGTTRGNDAWRGAMSVLHGSVGDGGDRGGDTGPSRSRSISSTKESTAASSSRSSTMGRRSV